MRKTLCALVLVIAAAGCTKKDGAATGGSAASGSSATAAPSKPGDPRRVAIEASANGYTPSTIEGKPGEKLVLVFTRTVDGDCMAQVKLDGGKPIDLPRDTAVEVPVTVPTTGKMQFACGMDMNTGVIVAKGG
jgi:plastocyanin domain-containing protein